MANPDSDPLLEKDLKAAVRGEVLFDAGTRAAYAMDASLYRHVPYGIVCPRDREDVLKAVEVCRKHRVPILPRGAGTSLAGQSCNTAVILDMTRHMNRILAIDPEAKTARVEPGVVLDALNLAARPFGLGFGPDPATHAYCTLGGMIGNNSCGIHSVESGKTSDNVISLKVLTYRGSEITARALDSGQLQSLLGRGGDEAAVVGGLLRLRDEHASLIRERYPRIPRRISGYNLDALLPENNFNLAQALCGTEGTCAILLEATLRLKNLPREKMLVVLGYPDICQAADDVPDILKSGPSGLEGLDGHFVSNMKAKGLFPEPLAMLPEGDGWLVGEFTGATREEVLEKIEFLKKILLCSKTKSTFRLYEPRELQEKIWKVRESAMAATLRVPGRRDTWPGWEDSAVAPEKLGSYLKSLYALMDRFSYRGVVYGHFGEACVHARIDFEFKTPEDRARYRSFMEKAADLVLSFGGSLSGEHGDGQARAEFLPRMFGPDLVRAFESFKTLWDPDGLMNPGKIVRARKTDDDLKFPESAVPQEPSTFRFLQDEGSFGRALERCIGMGKCRKTGTGTMCPSFMATGDEKHSTRGRAHLLYEMILRPDFLKPSDPEPVKEALDLCLSCKACKSECPASVDMASYKAEFLSRYYKHRPRPLRAHLFGNLDFWARLGSKTPALVNALTRHPLTGGLIKSILGLRHDRPLPPLAPASFVSSRPVPRPAGGKSRVLFWPDTFHNYFYPEVAKAAVESLERLGFEVLLPPRPLCCGRPLYDFGMLDQARDKLKTILDSLRDPILQGIPLVGLEPGCLSVFRDELLNLFPENDIAVRLARQTFLYSEFIDREVDPAALPKIRGRALVQGHCHQQAVLGMQAEKNLYRKLGLDFEILDSGCCGMAGVFGYESGHAEISGLIAERVMAPAMRAASADTLILANGSSCREQIRQTAGRKPLHAAEVVYKALREKSGRND